MCILFLYYSPAEGDYKLIAANNRDEGYGRPTAPAAFWTDHPQLFAGRDLLTSPGGTWFGVTVNGRFSVLTNYTVHAREIDPQAKSRGHLVVDFLTGTSSPLEYCKQIENHHFNGFSLLTADLCGDGGLAYTSNRDREGARPLGPGLYGLSNSLLDTPWQKVLRGKEAFSKIVSSPDSSLTDRLMTLLSDDTSYHPDPALPDAGFTEERYRKISAIFVNPCPVSKETFYGTRSQTVLVVGRSGDATYTERTLNPDTSQWTTNTHTFQLKS